MLISDRVKKVVAEQLDVNPNTLNSDTDFFRDLGCSLDIVEVIMSCEEEFGFDIPDADAEQLATIGKLTDYIVSKLEPDGTIWPPAPKSSYPAA